MKMPKPTSGFTGDHLETPRVSTVGVWSYGKAHDHVVTVEGQTLTCCPTFKRAEPHKGGCLSSLQTSYNFKAQYLLRKVLRKTFIMAPALG